jgi:hypothetical protein
MAGALRDFRYVKVELNKVTEEEIIVSASPFSI